MRKTTLCMIVLLFITGCTEPAAPLPVQPDDSFTIATWNMYKLSNDKSADVLSDIASILSRYDLIALQEVMDSEVLERLQSHLPGYSYTATSLSEGEEGEIYAFFYRSADFEVLRSYRFTDETGYLSHPPFITRFKTGNFVFNLINLRIPNNPVKVKLREILLLDEIISHVEEDEDSPEDTLLTGSITYHIDDPGWDLSDHAPLLSVTDKTTTNNHYSYDNLWLDPEETDEYLGLYEVYAFDEELYNNDDYLALTEISDHRPVSFYFSRNSRED